MMIWQVCLLRNNLELMNLGTHELMNFVFSYRRAAQLRFEHWNLRF